MDTYLDFIPLDILNLIIIYLNPINLNNFIKLISYLDNYLNFNYLIKLRYLKDYNNITKSEFIYRTLHYNASFLFCKLFMLIIGLYTAPP